MQPTLSFLLAIALAESVVMGQGLSWHTNQANGNRYAITPPMPWHQALQVATNVGGSLATVRNVTEHDWLVQTFCTQMAEDSRVWIGLNDEALEGVWVWSSGEPAQYRNWGLWEPDNSGDQDHAALWLIPSTFSGGWRWCDDQGGNAHPAIVEVRLPAAAYVSIGTGCHTNVLSPEPASLPRLGTTFHMRIDNTPQPLVVVLGFVGFSRQHWMGISLPRDLSTMGMPGCIQHVSLDITHILLAVNGTALWDIPVPLAPGLEGTTFFLQAAVPDPSVNALGAAVTNAGAASAGW